MARIKLTAPAKNLTVVKIPVRVYDINYGNHLGNDSLVSIIHEARVQWLHKHQYTELSVEGTGLILAELVVDYKQEAFYGDTLDVAISAGDITRVGFELYYTISSVRNNSKVTIAVAKTGMVCYNYNAKKPAPVPVALQQLLATGV